MLSRTPDATAARSTLSRGGAPAVIVAEASRSSTISPERSGVCDQRFGVPVQGTRITGTGATSKHLRAGVQYRQRGPQFMRGIGDEAALQCQRLHQRPHRPSGQQHHHRDRRQNACQFGESERQEQPVAPVVVRRQVQHRHYPAFRPVHHQCSKFVVSFVHVGETGWPQEQFDSGQSPVACGGRPLLPRRTNSMPGGGSLTSSAAAATVSNWALIRWFCTRMSTTNTTAPTSSSTAANADEAWMAAIRPARRTTARSFGAACD